LQKDQIKNSILRFTLEIVFIEKIDKWDLKGLKRTGKGNAKRTVCWQFCALEKNILIANKVVFFNIVIVYISCN
jgi:hypothetical protein